MAGVWKRIEGAQGETRIGSLIGWTFSVEPRGEGFAMVYRPTFSAFVDEVRTGLPSGLAIPKPSGSPERAEEEAMAARISENWDRFLDLILREQGLLPHSS
jgi:hypothetical protein